MTDKEKLDKLVAEIKRRYKECKGATPATEYQELLDLIASMEEEPVSENLKQFEDIELYARNEADKFASKEYEYHNDIRLLSKGFYWGCKAGANWQEQQIKKSAIYGIVAGRVKDEVFVASRWFKDDKLKPAEDIKLIIIKK